MKRYVTYLRVSTKKQGAQGLGIDAQRKMCMDFIKRNKGEFVQEFMDVESGTHRDRKGLWDAIEYCKANGCSLVIAKLDRLARDVEFCFKVMNTGIDIHFTDMPILNCMILGVFASVAQYEREMCSKRTKDALAAKKERGAKLGGSNEKFQMAMTAEKMLERGRKAAMTKRKAHTQSRSIMVFCKILRKVFPNACKGDDASKWLWDAINTRGKSKDKILSLMRDYQELEPTLFPTWDFGGDSRKLQIRLASHISNCRKSFAYCD